MLLQEKVFDNGVPKDSKRVSVLADILLSVLIVSAGIMYPFDAYAQESDGRFVEYSFTHSGSTSEEIREGSGNLRLAVIENFGNGTLRIEISGSLNNAEILIRNNVAEERFSFPYLVTLPHIDRTITGENGTITISTERLDDEEVDLQGTNWILNVSRITVEAEVARNGERVEVNADGELKILAVSGLLYGFAGSIVRGSSDAEIEVSVILVDTNLDLGARSESSLSIFSQVNTLASLGMGAAPFDSQALSSQSGATTPSYLLIGGLIGAIVLVSLLSVMKWRRGGRNDASEEKPLHWVH